MKKAGLIFLALLLFFPLSFAEELNGKNLEIINMASEARLFVNDYEELSQKLDYLFQVEQAIAEFDSETSEEAKLICKEILLSQRETTKSEAEFKNSNKNERMNMFGTRKTKNEEDDVLVQFYKEMAAFSEENKNLSSYFYLHLTEAKSSLIVYLPMSKQIKALTEMIESYEKLENEYPHNAAILFTRASFLYFMPKIAGGDKNRAIEKAKLAVEKAGNKYEKSSSLVLLSQFLIEQKKTEEAKIYFNQAKEIAPNNITMQKIEKMNDSGFSMFDEKAYEKKK